jgi:hypothetical protein
MAWGGVGPPKPKGYPQKKIKKKKKNRRLWSGLASQTSVIFFQTRWDCLSSKAAIYIAPTGLGKQEEKVSKWRRERERERGGGGDHKRKGKDEGEAEKGSANSLKGF